MAVTIKDIAKMAGVSISTVSRVLNKSKPVNEEVRRRVLDVVERTQFRPNAMARGLVKNESLTLGVFIPDFRDTVFDDVINGINHVAKLYGYDILLSLTGANIENELHVANLFREKQADGMIFSSTNLKDEHIRLIMNAKIPSVLVGQASHMPSIPSVHVDNVTASYEAVMFMIARGHQKIAMIRGPIEDEAAGDQRCRGYMQAMADAKLPVDPGWIVPSGFSVQNGMESMQQIIRSGKLPTAVFCASDRMAIGVLNALLEAGMRVPEDVSIMGFDGIDLSTIVRPKLSTVEYSAVEIGMTATRNLLKLIKGEKVPQHTDVPHRLVIRDSIRVI